MNHHVLLPLIAILLVGCHPFEDLSDYTFNGDTRVTGDAVEPGDTSGGTDGSVSDGFVDPDTGTCACAEPVGGGEVACCEGSCVEISSDRLNCGGCGKTCDLDERCDGGVCVPGIVCPEGLTLCGEDCVDTGLSLDHCGGCESPCAVDQGLPSCVDGRCQASETCGWPYGDCDKDGKDCETDLRTDTRHCGTCGFFCEGLCEGGKCYTTSCEGEGEVDCDADSFCDDFLTSQEHCGGCNRSCDGYCEGGVCFSFACEGSSEPNAVDCDGDSVCDDLLTSQDHCGGCDQPCAVACIDGFCEGSPDCQPNSGDIYAADCDGDGVCEDLSSSEHCGACYESCEGDCNAGTCENYSCEDLSLTSCTDDTGQVVCVDVLNDESNCGECGNVCSSGVCFDGVCEPSESCLDLGLIECDDPVEGPICVDIFGDDENNCGACGELCDGTCVAGGCEPFDPCQNSGLIECDDPVEGLICVDVSTDTRHCGDCNETCDGSCFGGLCEPSAECPSAELTGCEDSTGQTVCVDLLFSNEHCGSCGDPCASSDQCVDGSCQDSGNPACNIGETSCFDDASGTNVCADLQTSNDHCGQCGSPCYNGCVDGTCPNG